MVREVEGEQKGVIRRTEGDTERKGGKGPVIGGQESIPKERKIAGR